MATHDQIQKLINGLSRYPGCKNCGVRIRFGDFECPRCGADLDEELWEWAKGILEEIEV